VKRTTRASGLGTIPAMVEASALGRGDSAALILPSHTVTYEEVQLRLERISGLLQQRGVRRGSRCCVSMERGERLVEVALAVMRLGAAYVPLGPHDPPARRVSAVAEVGECVLIGDVEDVAAARPRTSAIAVAELDAAAQDPTQRVAHDASRPTDLAYVMFTSGSTGVPKAVATEHRAICNYIRFMADEYGLGPSRMVLQLAAQNYEAAIRDLFGPLATAASVVILPRSLLLDPSQLVAAVADWRINTILSIVPTFLSRIASVADGAERLQSVELVLTSGESLLPALQRNIRGVLRRARIVNQYGPTECTLTATFHDVSCDPPLDVDIIGRPITGVTVRVCDDEFVDAGANEGEIVIGGEGIARGYLNRPALTAAAFLPDPCSEGSRVYATGDRGVFDDCGRLVFRGRRDRQVKICGHRVELEEVEAWLRRHPAVSEAAVVAEGRAADRFLVAYVSDARDAELVPTALYEYLAQLLPHVMVPREFRVMPQLPRGPSGKIDYDALP
jgi:D-alanine--poly(phosphoribitol) ligase subunit 1